VENLLLNITSYKHVMSSQPPCDLYSWGLSPTVKVKQFKHVHPTFSPSSRLLSQWESPVSNACGTSQVLLLKYTTWKRALKEALEGWRQMC
jgi:hypothetical protein